MTIDNQYECMHDNADGMQLRRYVCTPIYI